MIVDTDTGEILEDSRPSKSRLPAKSTRKNRSRRPPQDDCALLVGLLGLLVASIATLY